MKIRIAEDDDTSRELLQNLLEGLGHEVVAHADGKEAWKAHQDDPARLIISDWFMPEVDGLELCRRVRGWEAPGYVYFILLTANTGREAHRKAMAAGVDDFLNKPLRTEEIQMRLNVGTRIVQYTTQISNLEDLLPICAYCKKVRDGSSYWQQVEEYISARTKSTFTHGVCPDCEEKVVRPQFEAIEKSLAS